MGASVGRRMEVVEDEGMKTHPQKLEEEIGRETCQYIIEFISKCRLYRGI